MIGHKLWLYTRGIQGERADLSGAIIETKEKDKQQVIKKQKPNTKREIIMVEEIKKQATSVAKQVEPYKKHLVAGAILIALDHFVLQGKLKGKIQKLSVSLGDKLASMVQKLIDKLD